MNLSEIINKDIIHDGWSDSIVVTATGKLNRCFHFYRIDGNLLMHDYFIRGRTEMQLHLSLGMTIMLVTRRAALIWGKFVTCCKNAHPVLEFARIALELLRAGSNSRYSLQFADMVCASKAVKSSPTEMPRI